MESAPNLSRLQIILLERKIARDREEKKKNRVKQLRVSSAVVRAKKEWACCAEALVDVRAEYEKQLGELRAENRRLVKVINRARRNKEKKDAIQE